MKNECSIIRDVLPLYFENIVSEETRNFVNEHLAGCVDCAAELDSMKAGIKTEKNDSNTQSEIEAEVIRSIKSMRKKFRRKLCRAVAVIAAVFLAICVLIQLFPVYRIGEIGPRTFGNYYTNDEIGKALWIGTSSDRREAQSILRLADAAFNDVQHTHTENVETYGLLARYATSTDSYGDVAYKVHSLELWSAHLDEDEGWIWVYYSSETFNHDGSLACGSFNVPSLWKVEKNDTGEWVVVHIKEHA